MNKYTNSIYEKIKAANKKQGNGRKDILKTVPTNTYVVRIVPNAEDPSKTFTPYFIHGWKSPITGRYTQTICPSTYGEDCPICSERFRLWHMGDEASKEASKVFARKERFYTNVYVVDDPTNADNNGTVKIYGYGRQIERIINEALDGADVEEFGPRIIDFSEEGCNLRIRVEKNAADFPNYDMSKFLSPCAIDTDVETAMEQAHDFTPLLVRKTKDELVSMLHDEISNAPKDEAHDSTTTPPVVKEKVEKKVEEKADEIPMEFVKKEPDEAKKENDKFLAELAELNSEDD